MPYHSSCSVTYLPIILKNWNGLNCTTFTQTWYPVGTNTCNPTVSNCAQGDGQPDGVYAGPWITGSHQVEFSPQLVFNQTSIGTYWKTYVGVYGNIDIDAKLDGQWVRLRTSMYQGSDVWKWEQTGIGEHAGKYISGLRFGFSYAMNHQFIIDGYRIDNFYSCTP